jgi:type IV pilus assembly protein PilM
MASNFAWGIDIGNRALKAVKLVREADGLRIDDFEVIEHETVLSNAGDNRESLVQSALANFVQRHPFRGGQVAVGVSGQSSFARFIKLPPVEPKKIPEIVRFEAIQQIPFPLDDVEWSYQLFQSPESPDVEVGIFAMRKELINAHIKNFTDYDLNVQVVQMNPLAVYNAMYHDGRLEDGTTMIVDMGAENTDLIIADVDTIWMRSIPIGGNSFTETLVKAFKLPFNKAEDMKRTAASSKYARQIFQAMRPIFADLVAEIQRSVGFYASVHRDSRIKKILALGGTFQLPGLQKYLQQNLQLDVERLSNIQAAPSSDSKLAPTFNDNILSVVSAYGLAIQAMNEGKVTSNLLPAKIRREKLWREKTKWFGAAAALFVLGFGVGATNYWVQDMSYAAAQPARDKIAGIQAQAKTLDSDWNNIEGAGAPDRQRISNVKSLLNYRELWPRIIVDINSCLPQAKKEILAKQPQLAAPEPTKLKEVPRDQRQMVLIDSITTTYYPDASGPMNGDLKTFVGAQPAMAEQPQYTMPGGGMPMPGAEGNTDMPGGMPGGMPPPTPGPQGPASVGGAAGATRGFLVVMNCTSPFAQAPQLISAELVASLLKIGPSEANKTMEYKVAKATLVQYNKISEDQNRLQKIRAEYQAALSAQQQKAQRMQTAGMTAGGMENTDMPGGYRGGMPAGAGGNVQQDDPAIFQDRVLGEDVRTDWEARIAFFIQLDPPPYQPPAGQPGQQTAAAH